MCDGEMSESQLSKRMMREVLTALQLFVNDGANELHFAINSVARNFLRPPASDGSGNDCWLGLRTRICPRVHGPRAKEDIVAHWDIDDDDDD